LTSLKEQLQWEFLQKFSDLATDIKKTYNKFKTLQFLPVEAEVVMVTFDSATSP